MTKRGSEHPKLLLRRTLSGWEAPDAYTAERMARYPIGCMVEMQAWEGRNVERLRLYWVVLHECVENSENKYGRAEDLHNALKIALGYKREIKLLNVGQTSSMLMALGVIINRARQLVERMPGNPVTRALADLLAQAFVKAEEIGANTTDTLILPGSVAFDRMDESEFRVFFDRAMNELRRAGYPIDEIMESQQTKTRIRPMRRNNPSIPVTNGGIR